LPFIKLKVMSPTEQLTSGNLINSAISLFLGTSFIFLFIFFVSNAYWYRVRNESRLEGLAKEINDSLKVEINSAFKQLDYYDKKNLLTIKDHSDWADTSVLIENPLKPNSYPYFDYAFYLDPRGDQKGTVTTFSVRDKPTNLATRAYFKNPDEWILPGNDTCRFRMESIVSVTSGAVKAAFSKRSQMKKMIIAMTGRFYSIVDPLMPVDYKFCIIDGSGQVWFHSDKLRNLQENLVKECNEDGSLSAAIYANAAKTLNVYYYDEPYRIHIESLAPVPLYLVTMYDKHAEYAYQVQVLMLTLLLFSALVLFIIIQTIALFLFKRLIGNPGWKNLIMDFIGAKEDHNNIYLVMSVILVLITLLYHLLINPVNILVPLISALAMFSLIFPYLNYAINGFSLQSVSLNLFAALNLVFLLLINIAAFNLTSEQDFYNMLILQGIILVFFVIGYLVLKREFTVKHKNFSIAFYVCFLMGLLLVYSVAPSIKFFEASVSHEIIRGIKHDQLELARLRESRNKQFRSNYTLMEQNDTLPPAVVSVFEHRMDRGIYSEFDSTRFYIKGKTAWKELDAECLKFIKKNKVKDKRGGDFIINNFRPLYDKTSIETKYLGNDSLLNGKQKWTLCEKSVVFDYYSTTEKYHNVKPVSCRIITGFQRPDIFNPMVADISTIHWPLFQKDEILFVLLLLLVLFGIYQLIVFGTRKMFGISILEMHTEYNFGSFIGERVASGQSVLVIGSPSVNPAEYIREQLNHKYKLSAFDFLHPVAKVKSLSSRKDAEEVLIVENFALDYFSPQSFALQLKEINDRIRQKNKMVIISVTSPYLIQDFLELKVNPNRDEKDKNKEKDKPDEQAEIWQQLLLSFKNILSNVNVLYTPEKYIPTIPEHTCYSAEECTQIMHNYTGDQDKNLRCLICRELGASTYLQRYAVEVNEFYEKLKKLELPEPIIKERILSRIMDLCRLYYDNILDSCTAMEKFVLSDMAQDLIVNSKNQKVVLMLIHRGLFVTGTNNIRFMNESFRKHVLLRFTPEEKNRLKQKLGDSGMSWQGYKLVLVLVMIGLFSFLFIANRSILDNLNKLFIVIGGGTVLITNLTGFLTRKETGNTK
jgi:hypothetical protein